MGQRCHVKIIIYVVITAHAMIEYDSDNNLKKHKFLEYFNQNQNKKCLSCKIFKIKDR